MIEDGSTRLFDGRHKQGLRGLLLLAVVLGSVPSRIVAQDPGAIRGTIIDAQTKQPIPLVNIILRATPYGAASDSAGQFEIPRVPPDLYILEISHVAYRKRFHVQRLRAAERATFSIELEPDVIPLPGVEVTADPTAPRRLQQAYASTVVTAKQIEQTGATRLTDVLRSLVPGSLESPMRRRGASPGMSLERPPFIIYLDGAYIQYIPGSLDYIVSVAQIERIEVSRWVGAAPNFGPGTSDRVLQIFTKRGKR